MNRILNRILSNIANGYEPINSELITNRFQTFTEI